MARAINNSNNNFQLNKSFRRGVTLIELMVVIALVVVLTAIVLLRQKTFENTILLRNTAYEFALSVREAQAYGVSVRRDTADAVSGRYGIHVSLSSPGSTILYSDNDEDNMYDVGEDKQINIFPTPFNVKKICVVPVSGVEECSDSVPSIIGLEVLFIRPDPDARLYVVRSVGGLESISKAKISIGAPENKSVDVIISSLGQVSVQ